MQIPNAGIIENTEVCQGNLQFIDGKPVAPRLLTLEVNLIGLFYSKRLSPSSLTRPRKTSVFPAVHLGMYYMKQNRTADDWKSLVMIGSLGKAAPLSSYSHNLLHCSFLGRFFQRTTIHRVQARSVGSHALSGPHRGRRKYPHSMYSPVVRR